MELPIHPQVVHLPLALCVLMPLLCGGLALAIWRGALPGRTWWLAVALQAVLVVVGVVAMQSGESDEEIAERVVPHEAIEAHEEAAEGFVWTAAGLLALMIAAGAVPGDGRRRLLAAASTVLAVVVFVLGVRTGEAGGRLVYEHGAAGAHAGPVDARAPTPPPAHVTD